MDDSKKIEFMPPQDFSIPEGTEDGDMFDVVCSFQLNGNKICLKMLGDAKMPGYDDKGNGKETKPDYSGYANGMQSQMNGGNDQ